MTRLVVVGDALLDIDLVGSADRLMPEAPVPVLDDLREVRRPGGAGLAAALAAGDGAEVVLVAPVPDDAEGALLRAALAEAGVELLALRQEGTTTVKRRVRARDQSLLRLDSGEPGAIGVLPAAARTALGSADAVLVADYGRGMTAHHEVRGVLAGLPRRIPLVWDPHPRGADPVPGARLATPNEAEATALSPDVIRSAGPMVPPRMTSGGGLAALSARAAALVEAWRVDAVAITLGARGALLSHGESSPSVLPAPRVTAVDTCGAGDRFASTAALALGSGSVTLDAVGQAVRSAAAYVAAGGSASYGAPAHDVEPGDPVARVRAAGGTVVATGGCFDLLHAGHVATLEAARALGDCLVVCLNSDDSVRRLKGPSRPLVPAADRARVLAALAPVDAVVVFDEDTPEEVLRRVRPDVWAKGGDYAGAELPEAVVLREWGGQSVVLPYLRGRSTTRLVETARAR